MSTERLNIMCCIPVEDSFDGPERVEFPETPALCIYYRGPYEGTVTAIRALMAYVKERGIETTGAFRSIYMEGPPNRGENTEDYITQVAVPIQKTGVWLKDPYFFFLFVQPDAYKHRFPGVYRQTDQTWQIDKTSKLALWQASSSLPKSRGNDQNVILRSR